jgi:hypothetical protein
MRKITTALTLAFILLSAGLALAHGKGHVMGTVAAVTAEKIEVKTQAGKTVAVPLTKETQYFKGKEKATWADVKVGGRVVAHLGDSGAAHEVRLPSGKKTEKEERK